MPIRGEAVAKLASGRKLTLVVNLATIAKTAAQTGIVAKDILPVLGDKNDPRQMLVMIAMVQNALHRHHRDLDDDDVGEMMLEQADADAIGEALMAGVQGAFGEEEEAGDDAPPNPPKAKRRGTGTGSRARGRKRG